MSTSELFANFAALREKFQGLQTKQSELIKILDQQNETIKKLEGDKKELAAVANDTSNVKEEIETLRARVAELEEELQKEQQQLSDSKSEAAAQLGDAVSKREELETAVQAAEALVATRDEELATTKEMLETISAKSLKKIEALSNLSKALQKERDELLQKARSGDARAEGNAVVVQGGSDDEVVKLKETTKALEKERDELLDSAQRSAKKLEALEQDRDKSMEQLKDAKKKLFAVQTEKAQSALKEAEKAVQMATGALSPKMK